MPDISMCANEECTLRETCYRFVATPNPFRQSYSDYKPSKLYVPGVGNSDTCDNYIKD
jgi:hypothetical protein